MKRGIIISNIATASLLIVWTSSQALPWKVAATPILWVLAAWLLNDLWELAEDFWKEVKKRWRNGS